MCFMTKCPYVPPHEFNIDFPHLMLRYRTLQKKKGQLTFFLLKSSISQHKVWKIDIKFMWWDIRTLSHETHVT